MAVTNDLATDRRVLRHAKTLCEAGHEVILLGRNELPTRHRRGWCFYLEFNLALRRKLRSVKPDIIWANDTDTLLGAWMASHKLHCPLVLDCHELFPEVPEIQHKPFVKWVWRTLERRLMPQCDALLTVCNSIAEYYKERYGVSMSVVRNISETFAPSDNFSTPIPQSSLKTLLYQGWVNLGRGVDWAIDALEWLTDCRLVIAGGGDLLDEMKSYASKKAWSYRILFTGRLAPEVLAQITPQADVGLVMLEEMGLSYHYALPNRIGDFVQAGVPIVVSDLPEMAAVVRRFKVGEVIDRPHGADNAAKAKALAQAVRRVLDCGKTSYDFAAAREDMDWNKEKQKLIECVSVLMRKCVSDDAANTSALTQ